MLQGPNSWADALPHNQFIVGLLEAVRLRTDGRKCDPCDRRGESGEAVRWCENCGEAMCEDCENQHSSLKVGAREDCLGHNPSTVFLCTISLFQLYIIHSLDTK